jgi:hypothetical protein
VREMIVLFACLGVACSILLIPLVRGVLVYQLMKERRELWIKLGSPSPFERDSFMKKYPYKGGREVFAISGPVCKLNLAIYLVLHVIFIVSASIIVFAD